jgi:hypothetical protein
MRPLIAYLFIIIFSLQIIPIKEIGEILYKGQITEEEVHGYGHNTDDSNTKVKKDNGPYFGSAAQNHTRIICLSQKLNTAIHRAENLPQNFVPEIITPPPNNRA